MNAEMHNKMSSVANKLMCSTYYVTTVRVLFDCDQQCERTGSSKGGLTDAVIFFLTKHSELSERALYRVYHCTLFKDKYLQIT